VKTAIEHLAEAIAVFLFIMTIGIWAAIFCSEKNRHDAGHGPKFSLTYRNH